MEAEEIAGKIRDNMAYLRDSYKVKSIGLFGSYVRDEQNSRSDVDLLVEFQEPISLLEFVALEGWLNNLIGRKVDLVMKSALKPRIGEHILKEVVYI